MAADPVIYCLENLTDYDQFERLCHDLAALDGFRNIEPLGGSKDKGRDALHTDQATGLTTVFAYSVREDWLAKLNDDAGKIKTHGHPCDQLVFFSTADYTATERDNAIQSVKKQFGFDLRLYGIERLASMLRTTHRDVVAKHPQIFCPPFFPVAGGLSLSPCLDQVIIDHVDQDSALAHWLARRLTLAGYQTWCRGLAPLAGSSVNETVRSLLVNRAYRYICILSPKAICDPDFSSRRLAALAIGGNRNVVLPAMATLVDLSALDQETKRLSMARFQNGWAQGLSEVEECLEAAGCPRISIGGRDLANRSYFPSEILINEPELLASNLFRVRSVPEAIFRFYSDRTLPEEHDEVGKWAMRRTGPTSFLSFFYPPDQLAREFGITPKGGALWRTTPVIDDIVTDDLVKELMRKTMISECRRRGLQYFAEKNLVFFPIGLLRNDHLSFRRLDGKATFFSVVGDRLHGRGENAKRFRYHLAPVFAPRGDPVSGYEIIVRIRVHLTNLAGVPFPGQSGLSRRKKLCKTWWNDEWLHRTMGVVQLLADGNDTVVIGSQENNKLVLEALPRVWNVPIRLNEEALHEAKTVTEEDIDLLAQDDFDDTDEIETAREEA